MLQQGCFGRHILASVSRQSEGGNRRSPLETTVSLWPVVLVRNLLVILSFLVELLSRFPCWQAWLPIPPLWMSAVLSDCSLLCSWMLISISMALRKLRNPIFLHLPFSKWGLAPCMLCMAIPEVTWASSPLAKRPVCAGELGSWLGSASPPSRSWGMAPPPE